MCDVRYILDLKKNLISFDTLDHNGFSYKSASGIINVSKDILTVIEGYKVVENIYTLLGTTIVSWVTIAESEPNSTVL